MPGFTPRRYDSQTGGEILFNKKLKLRLIEAQYRIKELEERLCPCEQHDWIEIHKEFVTISNCDMEVLRTYKCKTCGKVTKKYDWE